MRSLGVEQPEELLVGDLHEGAVPGEVVHGGQAVQPPPVPARVGERVALDVPGPEVLGEVENGLPDALVASQVVEERQPVPVEMIRRVLEAHLRADDLVVVRRGLRLLLRLRQVVVVGVEDGPVRVVVEAGLGQEEVLPRLHHVLRLPE